MNHTRSPKEDHLPDWAYRDNQVTQGDRVEADPRHPSQIHFSQCERPGFTAALPQQQPLILSFAMFPLLSHCSGATILSYPCECTNIAPFTSTILLPADANLYGTGEKAPSDLRPRTHDAYLTCETLHSSNIYICHVDAAF